MTTLEQVHQLAARSLPELADERHAGGRRCAAVLCGLIPPEILHAAGAVPMRVRATGHSDTDRGSTYFAQTHCSLVRHVFDMAMRGSFAGFDAVLFSTGCDHSRRIYDAWRHADAAPALRLLVPVSSDSSPAAVAALELELGRLATALRDAWGTAITDDDLGGAIRLYNRQRRLVDQVSAARRNPAGRLTGTDVLAIHQVVSVLPVDESNALLERLIAELPDVPDPQRSNPARLFLVSSHFEDLRRMAVIERFGGTVAGDLMCTGTGYFDGLVDETKPPMTALAERGLRRLSCAHAADEIDRRVRFIVDGVRDAGCDAVILDRLSFCAIAAAEFYVLHRRLRALDIPVLELEGELHGGGEGQLRTRLEAFSESLANRGSAR